MHIPGEVNQETTDLPFRRLFRILVVSIVVTAASVSVAAWLLPLFGGTFFRSDEMTVPMPPPASKLGIYYDGIRYTADGVHRFEADRRWIDSYGWVDRDEGIVHVPIDTAIDMVLKEGRQP
jgi:hypothetical protein